MKNEEPNFDEGWFENDWWDEEPEEKKDRKWIHFKLFFYLTRWLGLRNGRRNEKNERRAWEAL